jgi:hypothetical protein
MYEAVQRGDLDAAVANVAEDADIELMGPNEIPYAGTYRGPSGMKKFIESLVSSADLDDFTHDEFHGSDDHVTVIGHERGRIKETGREFDTKVVDTFELRDGKIRKFFCAYDTDSVAKAYRGT